MDRHCWFMDGKSWKHVERVDFSRGYLDQVTLRHELTKWGTNAHLKACDHSISFLHSGQIIMWIQWGLGKEYVFLKAMHKKNHLWVSIFRIRRSHGGFIYVARPSWGTPHSWMVYGKSCIELKDEKNGGSPVDLGNLHTGQNWSGMLDVCSNAKGNF